ncbi:MAG: NAD-dependent deacylase [Succinivibrionaceae bacterium]
MNFRNITILTGAGISAESRIPVFRSEDGLWERHRVEDVATYEGFLRNKSLVHSFYNNMRRNLSSIKPNAAHLSLAKLQKEWDNGEVSIITQNIDDLHERATQEIGVKNPNLLHMHGSLLELECENCGSIFNWTKDSTEDTECLKCNSKAMRPRIVWFGEVPFYMDKIYDILKNTDLFIVIGSSGVVYPAAGFAQYTRSLGVFNLEFNLEKSKQSYYFDKVIYGKAGEELPVFVDNLLKNKNLSFLQ